MLPLDSPRWKQLTHVYGSAEDVPEKLRQLQALDVIQWDSSSAFNDLVSMLYHQGDLGTGSFAAVPHLIGLAQQRTPAEQAKLIYLCSWIEAARTADRSKLPDDIAESYLSALSAARELAISLLADLRRVWVEGDYATDLRYLFSAIAAFDGEGEFARDLAMFDILKDCYENKLSEGN